LFHRASKGKGRGIRKVKKKDAGNTSVTDVNVPVPVNVTGEVDLSVYKDFFRELDMEVFVAMRWSLVMDKKAVKVRY
jgi:hypothetical protein